MFLIVTMMIRGLCVVFYCYDDFQHALLLFFIVSMMFSAVCVVFDCYDDD